MEKQQWNGKSRGKQTMLLMNFVEKKKKQHLVEAKITISNIVLSIQ